MDDFIGRLGATVGTDRAAEKAVGIAMSFLVEERPAETARAFTGRLLTALGSDTKPSLSIFASRLGARRAAMPASATLDDEREQARTWAAGKVVGAVPAASHYV